MHLVKEAFSNTGAAAHFFCRVCYLGNMEHPGGMFLDAAFYYHCDNSHRIPVSEGSCGKNMFCQIGRGPGRTTAASVLNAHHR